MAENPFQKSPFDDQFTDTPPSAKPATTASRGLAPTRDYVIKRAQELDVDPALALSIWGQESSSGRNPATSSKGAMLDFQVMPDTYRAMMGTKEGMNDRFNNVEAGLRYLAYGQKVLKTRDPMLLASGYHAGYDRSDLKRGIIPNTTDGMISTRDYARSVAARLGKAGRPRSVDDEFSDTPPLADQFADTPPELPAPKAVSIEDKPYFDRLTEETKSGFGDMTRSLGTARWALGGEDDATLAEELAKSFAEEQPKTEARKSIDAAYQDVTDAQGVLDTTKAGAKALYTSITNPKETSLEIARNAANALPTIAAGAAGAGAGAAIGGGAGALAGGVGAVPGALAGATIGGRAGMAVGTAATELGAEVQDMVQKRLAETKQPPTAQNILAIVSDKEFKDSALKQGLAKGLTVAAVDQVFLGLGGKIATAPARRIASQELAAQGMDMATSAGRKAAFASPAGQAALKAAAPSVAARAGAGAAAVGVDAAGESIGEGLSQKVARGEVDYGDALREGVVGLGQSVVETAAGATIESAKQAASLARGTNRPAPKASGPLGRAAETAATEAPRVTVTAQDGQVSGEVTGQSGNAVEVTGDDGQVYHFKTGPGGVQITPEAPSAPLSNALDGVAAEQPSPAAQEAAPVAPEPTPVAESAPEAAPVVEQAVEPAPKPTAPADMTDEQLTARLDYLKGQAKEAGWNRKLLDERRKVENEQAKRQPQQSALDLSEQFTDVPPTSQDFRQVADASPVAKVATTEAAEADLVRSAKPTQTELSTEDKARYDAGEWVDVSEGVDFDTARQLINQMESEDGASDFATKIGQGDTWIVAKRKKKSAANLKTASRNDAEPTTKPVLQPAPTGGTSEEGAGASQPPQAAPSKSKTASKEDLEHLFGIDKKRAKALERIAAGRAWFNDGVKAKNFITENGLKDTHETKKGKGGRWDIVAKPIETQVQDFIEGKRDTPPEVPAAPKVTAQQAAQKAAEQAFADGGTETDANRAATTALIEKMADNPDISISTEAPVAVAAAKKAQEASNVTNERASGQPAGSEEMGGGQETAQAAPVQPNAATEEVASDRNSEAFQMGRNAAVRGFRMDAPGVIRSKNDKAAYEAGWMEGRRQENEAAANDKRADVQHSGYVIQPIRSGGKEAWQIKGRTSADGIANSGMFASLDEAKKEVDRVVANEKRNSRSDAAQEVEAKGEEPNFADAKALIAEQKDATGNPAAEAAVRKKARDLAAKTPITDEKTVMALDMIATRLGMGEGRKSGLEYLPAEQSALTNATAPEQQSKQPGLAPGTRINGDVERAAADRLEKLYKQMALITNRNSREGNAKAAVRGVVEELRRPRTVTSVQAILEKASSDLAKNYGAFSDVIDEVAETLGGAVSEPSKIPEPAWWTEQNPNERYHRLRASGITRGTARTPWNRLTAQEQRDLNDQWGEKTSLFAENKLFTADAVEKARAVLRSKLNQLNTGVDPEIVMAGMTIAGAYIEAGVRSFGDYAKAMTDDLGPKIKPFLLSFYEAARNYPGLDTEGMTPVAEAKAAFDALNAEDAEANDQLANLEKLRGELEDKLASQGMVKDANVTGKLRQVINAIAEIKEPAIYKAVNGDGKLALDMALSLRLNEGSEEPQATVARNLRNFVEPYRTNTINAVLRAIGEEPTSAEAKGNDNEPQKLDQPGSGELAGEQPEAVQGAEQDGQAGRSPEGRSGTDVPGSERSGRSRVQPAGRMGDDAGEVSSLASRRAAGRGKRGGEAVPGVGQPSNQDIANAERGHQLDLIPTDGTRAQDRSDDFIITDEDAIGEGGQKTKFKQNVAAIRLLKDLQAENRQATRDEQKMLAKYVGWGGIPQAFYRDNGEVSKGWEKEAAELKDLLTPEEMAAAASSTRNAHYTSPEIVAGVWNAAKHFGFQGGRVLEPSVGVGNFFGLMPSALRSASQLTGVELDHITGGLAKQLYPQANIAAPVGFQDFSAPDNYFDLAIGNPPFGREGIYDANRRKISGFSIHNYFFAKSIDTVKPNGVLAMVVTNRLLDSVGDKARQYIADRAEFLGAIRLPNNAFAKNAGTEVTTDIIFLRKLKEGEQASGNVWMDVKQITDKNGKTVPLNEYFIRNPDMMLGEFGAFGSMYSPDDAALVAREGQDTPALLREAIAKLPRGFMDAPTVEPTRETIEPMHDISHVKVGSVFEQGGQIYERKEDMLNRQQALPVTFPNEKAKERVSGMIKVRDALVAVRRLQLTDGVNEKALEDARAGLNAAYDTFVKANGPLNSDANKRLMRDDPTWPQIAALEDNFDKGISAAVAKTTGEKARPASAKKSAIFFKRTQSPYKPPEKSNSAKDALVASLSERGRVDLDYMASLYGKTPEAIADELDGIIFEAAPDEYVTREEYLSGNVKKRLAQTIELAERMPRFKKNVEALRSVQPADIEAVDIDVKTGAHWVPTDVMQTFIEQITEGQNAKAVYNPINATWTLSADRIPPSAVTQWGTDRATVMKVLEAAANQKQITIYDEHSDGSRTLNEKATTAANEKVERVKAEWKNWLWSDDARRERLARIYNDTFNTDVQRDYDGSHLTFPGKVGNDIIQLRPHQANAVWRMVQSGTTLLDHVVGAGKTFTVIAGVMEMRRMGLARKPMLVVPNHLVGQWAEDFMKLYPGANILAATKKDFEKDNRKRLFARIATGDWDAVIVAHSSFGKVEVEPEFQEAFIRQQISDMDTSIAAMRDAEGKKSRNVKQIEKQKAALEEKLKKLFDTGAKDDNLYFSELGVDGIFLDEAHEFKNLGFSTGMQRVAGLGNPTGSGKASDMFMKVQAVLRRTNGRNVVFATGTPISNTMAEMYTMQRYLDYPTLKAQGISHFDAWAKTFGEVVTDWELSPSGQYKMNSRFAKFVNMPELMQRYQSFADVINRDDINRQLAEQGKKLPVPKVATGKPENIVVPRSTDQADYIGQPITYDDGREIYPEGSLIWRSENLPKKAEKGADNMLKIMSDARKAALDMRLINPNYPEDPNSKVNVAADNIKAIYDQWEQDKGTQLVFIDLSTPKGAVAKEAAALRELIKLAEEGDEAAQDKLDAMSPDELLALESTFSVYDDLKAKLIAKGIPEKEIAFIHDANTELQKEDLFGKVRSGRVRVLFGSTAKMGAGMNVQERLVALHHLDAPWRPSDLEQREGRIIRQGNKLYEANPEGFEVRIMRYATKQTLDSRMWQTIEAKARFIEQVRKGASDTREIEDVAGEAANSAEMKAASSGNPLILEEMTLRKQIRTLENSQSEHNREQYRVKDRMRMLEAQAERFDREAAVMESDAPNVPKEFAVTIGNQTFDKHGEAGEAILKAVDAMLKSGDDSRDIGTYGGFTLTVDDVSNGVAVRAVLTVKGKGEYQIEANPGSSTTGLALRLQNTVKGLAAEAERARSQAASNRRDIPKLEAQIKPWGQEQELADAKARHTSVIDQLRPKAKEQKPKEEEPAASRSGVEAIFAALEQPNKRNRMLNVLSSMPEGERIAYIDQNFLDILEELDDKSLVDIKC